MVSSKKLYEPSDWGQEFHNLTVDEALGAGSAGPGKALWVETPIPTPAGMVRMGDLRPGDKVYDEDGQQCSIVATTPVQFDRPCYEVVFDDGAVLVADECHEWLTIDYRERQSLRNQEKKAAKGRTGLNDQRHLTLKPGVRTTREISETMLRNGRKNHAVMCAGSLQNPDAELPIEPYILGMWLGDGTSRSAQFTTVDKEMVESFRAYGYQPRKTASQYGWGTRGLWRKLRLANLFQNKHIPEAYFSASSQQRLEVLQGLVDTDGHVSPKDGRIELTLCNERLAADSHRLVCSLGFKATFKASDAKLNGRAVGTRWRLCWSPQGRLCCRLTRKMKHLGQGSRTSRWRYIKEVRKVDSVPVKCIQVDSMSSLYLAGIQHIPTHNSVVLLWEPLAQIMVEHQRCLQDGKAGRPMHQHHQSWGSSTGWALHLRRTRPMLDLTISRAARAFPKIDPGAKWNGEKTTWTFSSGYRYQFGHCKDPDSWEQYMSAEFSWIGFDELVQFEQEQYDQISGRARSSDPVLRKMVKVRSMSNPVMRRERGESFTQNDPQWVRKYFVEPAPEGRQTIKKPVTRSTGETEYITRLYLPAKLHDNPDPQFVLDYERTLLGKPEHIRKALLEGDWWVTPGAFFADVWRQNLHIRKPFAVPHDWPRFRSMDWGFKSPGCVHWWTIDPDDNLICEKELTFKGKTDKQVAARIREIEENLGLWQAGRSTITGPADTQIWEERGNSAKAMATVFADNGIQWTYADKKSRTMNAQRVLARLGDHRGGTCDPGLMFFSNCKMMITTLPGIQAEATDPETPMKGGMDHWYDSLAYATAFASHGAKGIPARFDIDDEDEEWEERKRYRGRHGYGSKV